MDLAKQWGTICQESARLAESMGRLPDACPCGEADAHSIGLFGYSTGVPPIIQITILPLVSVYLARHGGSQTKGAIGTGVRRDKVLEPPCNDPKRKVKESEAIKANTRMREIESLLRANKMLTHEQHLKIVTLVRQRPAPEVRTKST